MLVSSRVLKSNLNAYSSQRPLWWILMIIFALITVGLGIFLTRAKFDQRSYYLIIGIICSFGVFLMSLNGTLPWNETIQSRILHNNSVITVERWRARRAYRTFYRYGNVKFGPGVMKDKKAGQEYYQNENRLVAQEAYNRKHSRDVKIIWPNRWIPFR